jgi:hypothetical protein
MPNKSIKELLMQDSNQHMPLFINAGEIISELEEKQREIILHIDRNLYKHWRLGRNIILSWSLNGKDIDILYIPFYQASSLLVTEPGDSSATENKKQNPHLFSTLLKLIKGSRYISIEIMDDIEKKYDVQRVTIDLPHNFKQYPIEPELIDKVIKRYSISYIENRAVVLFDMDGFTKYSAFEQVTLINSLAYSINSAHEKMLNKDIKMDFARSTTGDGFYIWNREPGLQANINLYHLMHLILADNAIARNKANSSHVPGLKTVFSIGDCYEFYQTEGLSQTMYSYIIGDVTIELARLIEHSQAGQIMVGDFLTRMPSNDKQRIVMFDSVKFIKAIQPTLYKFKGIELSGDMIIGIKCYFTGRKQSNNSFDIDILRLVDKHENKYFAYNAKINIYRKNAKPIYLGIQQKDIYV